MKKLSKILIGIETALISSAIFLWNLPKEEIVMSWYVSLPPHPEPHGVVYYYPTTVVGYPYQPLSLAFLIISVLLILLWILNKGLNSLIERKLRELKEKIDELKFRGRGEVRWK